MSTPVFFLDDESRHVGNLTRTEAEHTALKLLSTLKRLKKINNRLALNTARPISEYLISNEWTLQSVLGGKPFQLEWDFIRTLNDRSPLSAGSSEGLMQVVAGMEFRTSPAGIQSTAVAWATILDSATVSFAALEDWSRTWVNTTYTTLDDAGELNEAEGRVRNASDVAHADEHIEWLQSLGRTNAPTAAQIWNERADRYPGLRFLPRTEKDLETLAVSGAPFIQALSALDALAKSVANWGAEQQWPEFSNATPESEQRRKLCWVDDDLTGKKELFDWHTRFTGGLAGRVHFRVEGTNHTIVIAYIGTKLMREIPG
jgi:hypothetical protein